MYCRKYSTPPDQTTSYVIITIIIINDLDQMAVILCKSSNQYVYHVSHVQNIR